MAESEFNSPDFEQVPSQTPSGEPPAAPEEAPAGEDFLSKGAREFDMSKNAGLDEEDDVPSEMSESFTALMDSISQGRELKAREKEHEALAEQIEADREELADRENILMNYAAIAGEQDSILAQRNQERHIRSRHPGLPGYGLYLLFCKNKKAERQAFLWVPRVFPHRK